MRISAIHCQPFAICSILIHNKNGAATVRERCNFMAKRSRIIKVAGLSLAGFCAVSLVADKVAVNPEIGQLAGYCGAFLGALVGRGRARAADRGIHGTRSAESASETAGRASVPVDLSGEEVAKNEEKVGFSK